MTEDNKIKYRPDIDGLRAIAVIAVIAFHTFPALVAGGFVGVDIFFVISGFLITSIILEGLDKKRFSFVEFYARRVLRIFPALIVVLAACIVVGWFVLDPDRYGQLAAQVTVSAAFVANFLFWQQAGYFDTAAELKPLLHLWSLGVEEQFYFVWPLTLYVCYRWRRNPLFLITFITAISFALNIRVSGIDASDAFYLPHTRFWELMSGAILAYLSLHRLQPVVDFIRRQFPALKERTGYVADAQSFAGIGLIAAAVYLINRDVTFPGWWALLPTLGAFLLIAAGPKAWFNRRVLSHPVAVFIGLISYPLYLWHWVVLYFVRAIRFNPSASYLVAAIVLSFILAALTYALIELPIRRNKTRWSSLRVSSACAAVAMIFVAAAGVVVNVKDGIPRRQIVTFFDLPPEQAAIEAKLLRVLSLKENFAFGEMYGGKPCFSFRKSQTVDLFIENGCVEKQYPNRPTVFLIGDSHSASLSLGLRPRLADLKINFLQVSTGSCEPVNNDDADSICNGINAMVLAKIEEYRPDIVIVDAYWSHAAKPPFFKGGGDYLNAVLHYLSVVKNKGAKNVIVVGEIPTYKYSLPENLIVNYLRSGLPIPHRVRNAQPVSQEMDAKMKAAKYPNGVAYLSLRDVLCNEDGCLAVIGPDLERDILLWDYGHLTVAGSKFVIKNALEPLLAKMLPGYFQN